MGEEMRGEGGEYEGDKRETKRRSEKEGRLLCNEMKRVKKINDNNNDNKKI